MELNGGKDISKRKPRMALTREYKETVLARIKRDPEFARALYAEAVNALMEGETDEGLSMLRDLVHANITFKELSRQTGFGEKTLHRMLSRHGNPTTRNLFAITKAICEDLGIKSSVMLAT
jgi:DNA-binding phage protein